MIEELFFGNINPNEKQFIRNSGYAENMTSLQRTKKS